ncbi:phosphoribosylanthranilate isomerase [soil metagenome]
MIRIKICGVTTPSDAAAISELGADMIGLNFIRSSPRRITVEVADSIIAKIGSEKVVGLCDYNDCSHGDEIHRLVGALELKCLQPYNMADAYLGEAIDYIEPFRVGRRGHLRVIPDYRTRVENEKPIAIVIDSYQPRMLGGTGHIAPWDLLAGFDPGVPVILAGGLTPENVAEAISIVKPWGVDVASGVEKSPGVKDLHKVKAFIDAAREASSAL